MGKTYVIKSGDLYLKSEFEDDDIHLLILSGLEGYTCDISSVLLQEVEKKLAGKFDNVAEMARKTFSEKCDQHFSLSIESEGDKKVLVWRKHGGKAKLRLAQFDLKSANFKQIQDQLFTFIIQDRLSTKAQLEECQEKLEKKSSELSRASKLAAQLQQDQSSREEELINQFLPILNNKKRRIEELEHHIRENPLSSNSRTDVVNGDDDCYDVETDEETSDTDVNKQNDGSTAPKRKNSDSNGEPRKFPSLDYSESFEEKIFEDF